MTLVISTFQLIYVILYLLRLTWLLKYLVDKVLVVKTKRFDWFEWFSLRHVFRKMKFKTRNPRIRNPKFPKILIITVLIDNKTKLN